MTPTDRPNRLGKTRVDATALAALSVWLLATGVATAIRPGELFEMSLIGGAGAVAWGMLASHPYEPRVRAAAALTLALPLVNTWPARAWVATIDEAPALAQLLLAPSTLVIAAFVALAPWRLHARPALPYTLAACALVAAAALSSILSDHPGSALVATLHTHGLPAALGLTVATCVLTSRDGWALLVLGAVGAAVPACVGAAAYTVSFGVPLSGAELIEAKMALARPYLFQDLTFGNVGHLAALVVLTLPGATLGSVRPGVPRWLRAASAVAAAALLAVLVLTGSRSALAVAGVELACLSAVLLAFHRQQQALAPLAGIALVGAVVLSADVWKSYSALAPHLTGDGVIGLSSTEASTTTRLDALGAGLRVALENLPFGVGTGQYGAYDVVYTAPHSLVVQLLAENGIVGALAFGAVAALLLVDGRQGLRQNGRADLDRFLLRAACLVGALGFLLHSMAAGAPLALGQVNVWATLLWLQIGIVASLRRGLDRAE